MNNRELYDEIFAHVFTVDKSELGEDFVFGKVEEMGFGGSPEPDFGIRRRYL